MTLRLYAEHKKLDLGRITVEVDHGKVDADHCADCEGVAVDRAGRIDRFERRIAVEGGVAPARAEKLLEIADKCPVHRTLHGDVAIVTKMVDTAAESAVVTEV